MKYNINKIPLHELINKRLELELEKQKKQGKKFITDEEIDKLMNDILSEELKPKPYFTKYLPVEGEIKEGDIVLNTDGYQDKIYFKEQVQSTDKLLKLFLCTSNFDIGDRVNICHESYNNIIGKVKWIDRNQVGVVWSIGINAVSEVPFRHNEVVKQIGEVSPEALSYVREGDEFDEEEVCIKEYIGNEYLNICKIKGPCGRFH